MIISRVTLATISEVIYQVDDSFMSVKDYEFAIWLSDPGRLNAWSDDERDKPQLNRRTRTLAVHLKLRFKIGRSTICDIPNTCPEVSADTLINSWQSLSSGLVYSQVDFVRIWTI